ncbi:MAG: peptide deformylase [Verrucomicrobiota bacterium]
MILPIVLYGNPVLRKKGAKISRATKEHEKFITDLLETMRESQGIGLAAQQVGQAIQIAVVDVSTVEDRPSKMWIQQKEVDIKEHMPIILINPQLTLTKTKETDIEGCLSFPGIDAHISRSKRVHVKTLKLDGSTFEFEAAGLLGRAIQHETDHLHGILFTDRMFPEEKKLLKEKIEAIRKTAS